MGGGRASLPGMAKKIPLQKLSRVLKPAQVSQDPQDLDIYGRDWTDLYQPHPSAILFPETTKQVQGIVQWALKNKVALVPSGGRTGLSAGAFALHGEVVVSLSKMNKVLNFDATEPSVQVQAGVITENLQNFAASKGFYYPVDFASRGSSQIGGNIATNAGGIKVLRYGMTRQWVTGLQVVTGNGDILDLNKGLIKNASGYDLRHLFIGSEGTLGIITEATIALCPPPRDLQVVVLGLSSLEMIMTVFEKIRDVAQLTAYEMWTDAAQRCSREQLGYADPFKQSMPFYVLFEYEKQGPENDEKILDLIERLSSQGVIQDAVLSQNSQQDRAFWKLREDLTEATSHRPCYKNDVSVRVSQVPQFLVTIDQMIKKDYPDFSVVWFGHIGDGNLHINILQPESMDVKTFLKRCHGVDKALFKAIEDFGGSISAEHGVGLVKKPYLKHSRSKAEISAMKALKAIFDPGGILNPGKIF